MNHSRISGHHRPGVARLIAAALAACLGAGVFSCQTISKENEIDDVNPYGIYHPGQNKPYLVKDLASSPTRPETMSSYSFKKLRKKNGKISRTAVRIYKIEDVPTPSPAVQAPESMDPPAETQSQESPDGLEGQEQD